ncbi:allene oxide synthase-lipoxygenase protein-like [Ruditapes philippinarum]|uniref:allene oxide synthase-lipoxygenase protein-like n=1 Tax=Ruditapes philippinarum TaxID=129788 RepID=UPI00295AAFAE|nr:allene oxide synthase-lipoxygenase protein-like [Ruditapes philippinarum]XP_060586276.1 allene oxide synthase-lipoxygenase protein-like [Ruditapes philippinarum]
MPKRRHNGALCEKERRSSNEYTVCLEAADKPLGACRGVVSIKLRGNGKEGYEEQLAVPSFPDNFERGFKNIFNINEPKLDVIDELEIRGDSMIGERGWNIDRLTVTNKNTGAQSVFPVFTNIKSDQTYTFNINDVSLPQQSSNKKERQRELNEMRELYELTEKRLPGCPPLVKKLPPNEDFSFAYKFEIGGKLVKLKLEEKWDELISGEFESMENIEDVFGKFFPKPSNLQRWRNNKLFGMQRLMGVNPDVIHLCTKIPSKLPVNNEMLKPFLEISLEDALTNKRIFIVDYEIMDGLPTKPGFTMTSPIALFYQQNDGTLIPIAIQLFQKPGVDNPVFLPSDPEYTWILAKMWFNVADANYHESVTHLGFTHLKMEGIVAITHRQIYKTHPIYKLLMPHFLDLIAINWTGIPELIGDEGYVVKLLNIGREGLLELINRKNKNWRMDVEGTLPNDMKERGLDDTSCLPEYYYRDDAMEIYNAIFEYVKKYLDLYYPTDNDVMTDQELQKWRKEMVAPVDQKGLGMLGVFGKKGKFTEKRQVCLTLTSIIFTCSAKHAAVNFRQYEEYAFPPNYPLTLRGLPPKTKEDLKQEELVKYLPQKERTYDTLVITDVLSTFITHALGDFEAQYITDEKALRILAEFRNDLANIAYLNKKRNNTERKIEQYWALNPTRVPNSIAI